MDTDRVHALEQKLGNLEVYALQMADHLANEGLLGDARSWRHVAHTARTALDGKDRTDAPLDLAVVLRTVARRLRYHDAPQDVADWIDQQLESGTNSARSPE